MTSQCPAAPARHGPAPGPAPGHLPAGETRMRGRGLREGGWCAGCGRPLLVSHKMKTKGGEEASTGIREAYVTLNALNAPRA